MNIDIRKDLMTLTAPARPVPAGALAAPLPVLVIGAGPIGLAAAAHLAERGEPFRILEAGDAVGASIRDWGHIRLFSPWRHLVDPAARRLLAAEGWVEPESEQPPTGAELVERYLEPLAALPAIAGALTLGASVEAVSRERMDRTRTAGRDAVPFVVRVRDASGVVDIRARAVIDASGVYTSPNPIASNGLPPLGLDRVADRVLGALPDVRGRDRSRLAGRRVTVVGAGHSAVNTLLALAALADEEPGTAVRWVIRSRDTARISRDDADALSARASLGTRIDRLVREGRIELVDRFEISAVEPNGTAIDLVGERAGEPLRLETDVVVAATGFRPRLDLLRELRLDLDEVVEAPRRLAPLIDPNVHSCGTVEPHGADVLAHPERDLYLVGAKSYGRAPTFLLATGYEQVRSVVAQLAGDVAAARRIEFTLPAGGACGARVADAEPASAACCG